MTSWSLFTGLFFYLKKSIFGLKNVFFLINFIRILWFIWDLGPVVFDNHKHVVSGTNFGFWGGNWAQKWTKAINFGYASFPIKLLILKDCSETFLSLMKDVPMVEISANSSHFCRRKGLETSEKGLFHGCCITTKTFKNFLTWQPQMPH